MASVTATCAAGQTTKTLKGGVCTHVLIVCAAEQVCASACDTMHCGIHGQPLCCNICVKTRTRSCALHVFFFFTWLYFSGSLREKRLRIWSIGEPLIFLFYIMKAQGTAWKSIVYSHRPYPQLQLCPALWLLMEKSAALFSPHSQIPLNATIHSIGWCRSHEIYEIRSGARCMVGVFCMEAQFSAKCKAEWVI